MEEFTRDKTPTGQTYRSYSQAYRMTDHITEEPWRGQGSLVPPTHMIHTDCVEAPVSH